MLFNTLEFVGFFAIVYAVYLALPRRPQNRLLLVASYVFYGSWDWRFLFLIFLSTVVDYFCGRAIHRSENARRRKMFVTISVVSNLAILGFFKYFNFFTDNLISLLDPFGLHLDPIALTIVLPVGISFYTFQTLSYSIDIYRQKLAPEHNFFDFALFVAFFPQLVAGPIERAIRFLPQVTTRRRITPVDLRDGTWFVLWGYFLKAFVADPLGPVADAVFSSSELQGGADVVLATYAFAFQIFGDFAGYSFIAIGVSKLMGFDLMTNFGFPYFVTNPQEFWRHWHISLSTWLRDYLYISFGGSRGTKLGTYRNLVLTMILGGMWHGAAWTFLLWGAFHGAILVIHRWFREVRPALPLRRTLSGRLVYLAQVVFMFHVTCVGWLIFRSESIGQALTLGWGVVARFEPPSDAALSSLALVMSRVVPVLAIQALQCWKGDQLAVMKLPEVFRMPILLSLILAMLFWGEWGSQTFLYFQF